METRRRINNRKPTTRIPDEEISTSRVVKSLFLTFLSLFFIGLWCYHAVWAVKVMIYKTYGNAFNNLIFGPGTAIANAGLSIKLVTYLNIVLLDDKIDADHKKYI